MPSLLPNEEHSELKLVFAIKADVLVIQQLVETEVYYSTNHISFKCDRIRQNRFYRSIHGKVVVGKWMVPYLEI